MRERLKRVVLKTTVRETVPGVRIPLPPPFCVQRHSLTGDDSVFPSRASDSDHPLSVLAGCWKTRGSRFLIAKAVRNDKSKGFTGTSKLMLFPNRFQTRVFPQPARPPFCAIRYGGLTGLRGAARHESVCSGWNVTAKLQFVTSAMSVQLSGKTAWCSWLSRYGSGFSNGCGFCSEIHAGLRLLGLHVWSGYPRHGGRGDEFRLHFLRHSLPQFLPRYGG